MCRNSRQSFNLIFRKSLKWYFVKNLSLSRFARYTLKNFTFSLLREDKTTQERYFSNFWFCLLPRRAVGCDLLYWSAQSEKPESWILPWILFNLERIWRGLLWTWVSTTKTSLCLLAADRVGCSFNLVCTAPTDQSSDRAPFSRDCQEKYHIVYTSFLVSFYLIWEDGRFDNNLQ